MKKIFFAIPLVAAALVSCDPSMIDESDEWSQFEGDIAATVKPQVVDGVNSNVIDVACSSPVVTAWEADQLIEGTVHTVTTSGTIYFTQLGNHNVRCYYTNAGGTPIMKEYPVTVDKITYLTSKLSDWLCVGKPGGAKEFSTSFDKNLIKVEQELINGNKANTLKVVENSNPVLCTFHWNDGKLAQNLGQVSTYDLGEYELFVDYLDATGKTVKDISLGKYQIDAMTVPEVITLLTGYTPENPTATKTWRIADGEGDWNWGNGANTDKQASWWTTTVEGQGGVNGEMTFSFSEGTLTKVLDSPNPTEPEGTGAFSIDLGAANPETNVLCVINTTEPGNIVYPVMINQGDYHPTRYEVTLITEDELVLRAQHTNDATWEGCFWHFKAKK